MTGTLIILVISFVAWAHSEPPPPPPEPPIPPKQLQVVEPLRWSWTHWWEANRSLYLISNSQSGAPQSGTQESLADLRKQAADALIDLLDHPEEEPRAAAALALGRMRASEFPQAIEALQALARKDTLEYIRARALLAIGLIGGDAAESLLLEYEPPSSHLRAASLIGMGLLRHPSERVMTRLDSELTQGDATARNAAWWALTQHTDDATIEYATEIIKHVPSPWLASNALLTFGQVLSDTGDRALVLILLTDKAVQQLPVWSLLTQVAREKPKAAPQDGRGVQAFRDRWIHHHKRVFAHEPTPVPIGGSLPDYKKVRPVIGIEDIYKSRLRSSAAIALAGAEDQDIAVEALSRLMLERDNDYNTVPKCFALISLAQIGSPECLGILLEAASNKNGRRSKRQKDLESPLRGFAMIGLGLYAREQQSDQGPYDHPGYERALEMLRDRLADKREKLEARAAAAVALGLSGRTENLKLLIGDYETFDEVNPLLGGYVLLGRALLGDLNVIEHAQAALERNPHRDKTTDLLARRAAVLAMGVAGTNEAIPHLIWAWDQPFYVNREVIFALSLCEAPGVAVHLLPRLSGKTNRYERAFMAEAVGRLLNPDRLPPLSAFLIGSNFTVKDGLLNPIRMWENQFMYEYLIPQFEEVWY